jgi:hypothetical protein
MASIRFRQTQACRHQAMGQARSARPLSCPVGRARVVSLLWCLVSVKIAVQIRERVEASLVVSPSLVMIEGSSLRGWLVVAEMFVKKFYLPSCTLRGIECVYSVILSLRQRPSALASAACASLSTVTAAA